MLARLVGAHVAVLFLATVVLGQEAPQPTKEHGFFKQMEGTWDVDFKFGDAPPTRFLVKSRMVGGLWLISEHEGSFGGMPFKGIDIQGYDPVKKKVIGTWVDSFSTSMTTSEGEWSSDGKKLVTLTTGVNNLGKLAKWKSVTEVKDADTYVFTMTPEPGNEDHTVMSGTYRRKK